MCEFSIIIPAFNRADILSRAIQSVVNQSFQEWELIIIDDGSTDHTNVLVSPYLKDSRIRYYHQENGGVCKARNSGAERALSEWLIFLDSDDELTKTSLTKFNEAIIKNLDGDLFLAGNVRKNIKEEVTYIPQESKYFAQLSGTFCIRRSIFQKVGGYDPRFYFGENSELFYRIGQLAINKILVPEISLIYHESINGGSKNAKNIVDSISLFLIKHGESMSIHHKYLYHQIVGVNLLRFRKFEEANQHLWKSFLLKPYQVKTLARLLLSYMPFLSKKIYKLL